MIDDPRKRSLGRGLSALLGEEDAPSLGEATQRVRIDLLRPGRFQPRRQFDTAAIDALAQSIREKGVLQPLLVRRHVGPGETYEIVAGERRWRAAQAAQLHEVPIIIREIDDREALEIALVENLQRQDLSPLEEAEAYRRLMEEFAHTQEDVARAIGKSRPHVANTLRLLELPEAVRKLIDEGKLTAGHARALLAASDPVALAEDTVKRGLNVRQVERLAKEAPKRPGMGKKPPSLIVVNGKDADTRALEHQLSMKLGLAVSILSEGVGGTLAIRYRTLDQLDEVLRRLSQPIPPKI